jgi:hypothetical protein
LGNGKGEFGPQTAISGLNGEPAVTADFNGDGVSDIATFAENSNDVTVILSNGDATFQQPQTYFAGPIVGCVAVGDFNSDGKIDLAVCIGVGASVHQENAGDEKGEGSAAEHGIHAFSD